MPLLAWNNYSAILPLDPTVTPPDLSMRTDMAETLTSSCHRAVLASASSMLAAIFRERCTCEHITVILPGVSNTILEKLVSWLYSGEMGELSKEVENEWDTLVKMLGLEGFQLIDEDKVKNGSKSEKEIVKSLNGLTLNDSYLKSTRNPVFCDVDIFTSDDDSFVVVNENDDLSEVVASETPVKVNISSCVQCDLSEDEYKEEPKINKSDEGDEAMETIGNSTDLSLKNDAANGSNSSSSDFQDATTTLGVDINTTPLNSSNDRDIIKNRKVLEFGTCHDETVYQDCEEELDDNDGAVGISRIDDSVDKTENNSLLEGNVGQSPRVSDSDDGSTFDEENIDESFDDDDETDDDPSWNVSGSDDNEESDGEEALKAENCPPLGDITNINFSTVNTSVLGVWLSDTGPVHLVTRCLCKGTCVRSCACRTAGGTCSKRCSCKPSKCKIRAVPDQDRSLPNIAITGAKLDSAEEEVINEESCLVPAPAVTPSTTSALGDEDKSDPSHLTPTCPPIPLSSSTSKLSTTAKKKRKLFTASVGPQEI